MRVLVVRPGPHFSVQDVAQGWVKGLRANGANVVDFNLDDRLGFYCTHPAVENAQEAAQLASKGLEAACYEFLPDVVVIVSGFFIPPAVFEIIRARGSKIVLLHTESPYEDERQIERANFADLNVLNDPTNLDRFPKGTVYLPHSFDPDIHHPQPSVPEAVSDFCFVGTGYPSRAWFLERVDFTGIDVAIAGNWGHLDPGSTLRQHLAHPEDECCPNDQAAILYASTKVSANLYRKESGDVGSSTPDGWSMGPREVELAAIGTFFMREPRAEGDDLFPMLPTFIGPGDFGEKLRWWLAHDTEREEAALKAQAVVQDRTFDVTAARLLSLL
jgi:spore maturation protein CgeB